MHYTYILIDPRDESVFYVGKGSNGRIHTHAQYSRLGIHSNPKVHNKIARITDLGLSLVAEKIFQHEDEWPCLLLEIMGIQFYGRIHLCNLTDGGEGITNLDPESNAKRSASLRGIKRSDEYKAKMSVSKTGVKGTPFTVERLVQASINNSGEKNPMFGKKASSETRDKMSKAKKGKNVGSDNWNFGRRNTPEQIAALCLAQSGEKNGMFGRKHSPETRAKLRSAYVPRDLSGANNGMFGKKNPPSAETLAKRAETRKRNAKKNLPSPELVARRVATRKRNKEERARILLEESRK